MSCLPFYVGFSPKMPVVSEHEHTQHHDQHQHQGDIAQSETQTQTTTTSPGRLRHYRSSSRSFDILAALSKLTIVTKFRTHSNVSNNSSTNTITIQPTPTKKGGRTNTKKAKRNLQKKYETCPAEIETLASESTEQLYRDIWERKAQGKKYRGKQNQNQLRNRCDSEDYEFEHHDDDDDEESENSSAWGNEEDEANEIL